ncbi:hypothetical protein GCM10011418_45610 [Sphingobacterium alkalisoli]|nr:hypothetical protein GCM10011418_45610 [Sphingobacterium alkalisoli]
MIGHVWQRAHDYERVRSFTMENGLKMVFVLENTDRAVNWITLNRNIISQNVIAPVTSPNTISA